MNRRRILASALVPVLAPHLSRALPGAVLLAGAAPSLSARAGPPSLELFESLGLSG